MSSLIHIECKNSTEKSPIAYFEDFFSNRNAKLKDAMNSFEKQYPNPQDPKDQWNRFPTSVNKIKKTITVDYLIEEFTDEDVPPLERWETVIYSFEGELEKLFRDEFINSAGLIRKKIKSINSGKIKKKTGVEFLSKATDFLLKAIDHIDNSVKPRKIADICARPYCSLIAFFYNHFPDLMPLPQIDPRIGKLFKNHPKHAHLYVKTTLSVKIIEDIFTIKDAKSILVFQFHSINDTKVQLIHFFNGEFNLITSPITFSQNLVAANYLIAKLAIYLGYTRPKIEKANIFKLGKSNFIASLCDKDFQRLHKTNRSLYYILENMFENHLS